MMDGQHGPEPATARPRVELVATTGDIASTVPSKERESAGEGEGGGGNDGDDDLRGYFETAQWTADGTTVLTYSSAHEVCAYAVPEDLLAPRQAGAGPLALSTSRQATLRLPEPSNAVAPAPYFALAEPWTNQVLVSARDHPIQLFYLSPSLASTSPSSATTTTTPHSPAAAYPFTKARSETLLSATSLLWPSALGGSAAPAQYFLAGSRNLLAKFDVSRPGASSEPVLRIKTIPSDRHLSKGGGVGMRGVVSALGAQPYSSSPSTGTGLVAAGTWTRWVGLYDFGSAGECVATWSVGSAASEPLPPPSHDGSLKQDFGTSADGVGGAGITQTIWSPCGRYLVIGERRSRGLLVYDVRVTGRLLARLVGREAVQSNQRVLCDVFPSGGGGGDDGTEGFEVWSGTAHDGGAVRVWDGVGTREGAHPPSWGWRAHGGDDDDDPASTIGSTCLHPSGSVVATCSGSWAFPTNGEDGDAGDGDSSTGDEMAWMRRRNRESSLKLWSLVTDSRDDDDYHDTTQVHPIDTGGQKR